MYTAEQAENAVCLLEVPVSTLNMEETCRLTSSWTGPGLPTRCVTFANAHMLAVAARDGLFRDALWRMDLNCPDGRPLMWVGRYLEHRPDLKTVSGPDFLPCFIEFTRGRGLRHFFLGAAPGVAEAAIENLRLKDPALAVVGVYSPPYGPLTEEGLAQQAEMINRSGADVVWVSLGCPKQEWWMARNRARLEGKVVFAVGQAFDITAGRVRRAPRAARYMGMEWLYRLLRNPLRLATRYSVHNGVFLLEVFKSHIWRSGRRGTA